MSLPVIGATAMVFGMDTAENLHRLKPYVSHAEILLYWTPTENNFPNGAQVTHLAALAADLGLTLSVHLPPMPDLVTVSAPERKRNLDMHMRLIHSMETLQPTAYVLHLGPNPPVITAQPNTYVYADTARDLAPWYAKGLAALAAVQQNTGLGERLLVENLDFSPCLLRPFLEAGLAKLCLDIGHVWLSHEDLTAVYGVCEPWIKEIHLHGVKGAREHLGLLATAPERLRELAGLWRQKPFGGIINLEVFCENDLRQSLNWLGTNTQKGVGTQPTP